MKTETDNKLMGFHRDRLVAQVRCLFNNQQIYNTHLADDCLAEFVEVFHKAEMFDQMQHYPIPNTNRHAAVDPLLQELLDRTKESIHVIERFNNAYTAASIGQEQRNEKTRAVDLAEQVKAEYTYTARRR